jgi:hypothetical protein
MMKQRGFIKIMIMVRKSPVARKKFCNHNALGFMICVALNIK